MGNPVLMTVGDLRVPSRPYWGQSVACKPAVPPDSVHRRAAAAIGREEFIDMIVESKYFK